MHLSGKTLSQTVTINVRNVGLKHLFAEVERQTGYTVLYSDEVVERTSAISINVTKIQLEKFLAKVLSPVSLTYRIDGTSIFIKPLQHRKLIEQPRHQTLASVQQQQRTVIGKVSDDMQNPLGGVTVTVKGTLVVTTTDSEGNYRIQLPEGGTVLTFSNVGFRPIEEPIGERNNINIAMAPSVSDLDEVVVVGYGTME